MARTQDRRRSSATSRSEDAARRSSFGRINKQLFIDGPLDDSLTLLARIGSRLAGWLVTGPLGFLLATTIDVATFALRSLAGRRWGVLSRRRSSAA